MMKTVDLAKVYAAIEQVEPGDVLSRQDLLDHLSWLYSQKPEVTRKAINRIYRGEDIDDIRKDLQVQKPYVPPRMPVSGLVIHDTTKVGRIVPEPAQKKIPKKEEIRQVIMSGYWVWHDSIQVVKVRDMDQNEVPRENWSPTLKEELADRGLFKEFVVIDSGVNWVLVYDGMFEVRYLDDSGERNTFRTTQLNAARYRIRDIPPPSKPSEDEFVKPNEYGMQKMWGLGSIWRRILRAAS